MILDNLAQVVGPAGIEPQAVVPVIIIGIVVLWSGKAY